MQGLQWQTCLEATAAWAPRDSVFAALKLAKKQAGTLRVVLFSAKGKVRQPACKTGACTRRLSLLGSDRLPY